jgi:3-oxoacyl-[acyl-carrier-protein] synthase II
MRDRVLITGIGSISSFGVGHDRLVDALLAGATGIDPITAFDTTGCRSHRAAMVRGFDPAAFIPPMKLRRVDEVGRLAIACAKLTLEHSGVRPPYQIGVALGTYTAGLDSTVAYMRGYLKDGAAGVPALLFSNTVSNAPASLCAIEFALRGPNVTFNQREASSLAALMYASTAVRDGRVAAMLSGGADRVDEVMFKVYDRFHALSPRAAGQEEGARPFDARRNGFVLGEGAFTVLLESERSASARGTPVFGEILGCGASSSRAAVNAWPAEPAGLVLAMRGALTDAGLTPDDVHAVFGTANGSIDLDAVEASALTEVFGGRAVPVSSVKGAVGESGASGAAALVAGLLTMPGGRIPPTAGWSEADAACPIRVSGEAQRVAGDVFLVNSVASGGTNYSIAVRVRIHA